MNYWIFSKQQIHLNENSFSTKDLLCSNDLLKLVVDMLNQGLDLDFINVYLIDSDIIPLDRKTLIQNLYELYF